MPTGLGVDVHPRYQAGATFPGVEYAWIKMTDGGRKYSKTVGATAFTADEHARRLRAAGIPFGGYDYAQPGDGAAAARGLLAECRRLGGLGVVPATDIEDDPNIHTWSTREATDHGRAFCAEMRKNGIRPAVYMNASKMQACRPDLWPENPVIWVARYGAKPEAGGTYKGRYDVHQYTSSGSLPGSAGAVDWNQSYNTAHLNPQEGDMAWTEADFNTPLFTDNAGTPAARTIRFRDAMAELRTGMKSTTAALQQALQLLADSPDLPVTEERLKELFREVVRAETGPVVREVLGEDNAAQADAIVDELAQRLQIGGAA
ncbi:GH25 family lysozyme [Amycolatopsis japonica]